MQARSRGKVAPNSAQYTDTTHPTAKVIASFTAVDWEVDVDGYNVIVYPVKNVSKNMYFRLRGTNPPGATELETGPAGPLPSQDYCSPLADALMT